MKIFAFSLLLLTCVAEASPLTPGNLLLLKVGDGATNLTQSSTRCYLQEFSPQGALVQTKDVPSSHSLAGLGYTEGTLFLSSSRDVVTWACYRTQAGVNAVAASPSSTVPRAVLQVEASSSITEAATLGSGFDGVAVRSAVTDDSTGFWTCGGNNSSSSVRFCVQGANNSQGLTQPVALRALGIWQGQLVAACDVEPWVGISAVGSGLPMTPGQPLALLQGFPGSGTSPSIGGFWFSDSTTLYIADDRPVLEGGGLQKWILSGGQWLISYTLNQGLAGGLRRLAGQTDDGLTTIYVLSARATANELLKVVDTGPTSSFQTLATAPARTAWRGISMTPETSGVSFFPDAAIVFEGELFSGDVNSLRVQDGESLSLFSSQDALRGSLFLLGRSPLALPNELRVRWVTSVARPGISEEMFLYNVASAEYDSVLGRESTTVYSSAEFRTSQPSAYFDFTQQVQARLDWQPINDEDPTQDGWLHSVDLFVWTVN